MTDVSPQPQKNQIRQLRTTNGLEITLDDSILSVNYKDLEHSWSDNSRPEFLDFDYMEHMDIFLNAMRPNGVDEKIFHAGAGGCALAKCWEKTRPGSRHVAVDYDKDLIDFMKNTGWIKPDSHIHLVAADARKALEETSDTFDIIVRDVFVALETPYSMTTLQWAQLVKSKLRPGGIYFANILYGPEHSTKYDVAATAQTFDNIAIISFDEAWDAEEPGNVTVVGWDGDNFDLAPVRERVSNLELPTEVYDAKQISKWLKGIEPKQDIPVENG